jgi:glycosyltransferase involved in cell wall biosynthesis
MEAMLAGVPAVVSDVGDLAELVEDGVNGYRVPAGDVDGFADRIGRLLDEPDRRESFSRAARHAAGRHEAGEARRRWDEVFTAWDEGRDGGGGA